MKRTIPVILSIVLLGGLVYSNWRYWHRTGVISNKTTNQTAVQQTPAKQNQANSQQYLVVKEWGVRFKLSAYIDDATYTYKDTTTIYVSAGKLRQVKGCENPELISIQRGKQGDPIGSSNVDEVFANNPSALTKLDDYYYIAIPSPMNCAKNSDASTIAVLNGVTDAFRKAVKTVERSD